jgi:hypothetical protein
MVTLTRPTRVGSTPDTDLWAAGTESINDTAAYLQSAVIVGRLVVFVEPAGDGYVAEDIQGFTYGVGKSPIEAVEDWDVALRGKYAALSESAGLLVPYLADQLSQMKSILEPTLDYGPSAA